MSLLKLRLKLFNTGNFIENRALKGHIKGTCNEVTPFYTLDISTHCALARLHSRATGPITVHQPHHITTIAPSSTKAHAIATHMQIPTARRTAYASVKTYKSIRTPLRERTPVNLHRRNHPPHPSFTHPETVPQACVA